jgi:hypothetical protein
MKTRSSSGVGQKVDLEYNMESLRITDLPEDQQGDHQRPQTMNIMNQIKAKSTVEPETTESGSNVQAEIGSNKLKSMLASIKAQAR